MKQAPSRYAIIFDMDGLLINSEPYWRKAEIEVFKLVDIHLSEADCIETMGWRTSEIISYRFNQKPWKGYSLDEIEEKMIDRVGILAIEHAQLLPFVIEALDTAKQSGCKVGLASSSPMRLIERITTHFGIKFFFEVMHSAEKEKFGKPHSDVFIHTANMLGVESYHCIAIEDSINGVISAKSARMKTIAVPAHDDPNISKFVVADVVLSSLEGFNSQMIEHLL